jgi:hypothetical protein
VTHLILLHGDFTIEERIVFQSFPCKLLMSFVSFKVIVIIESLEDSEGGGSKSTAVLARTLVSLNKKESANSIDVGWKTWREEYSR